MRMKMDKPYSTIKHNNYELIIYKGVTPLNLENDNVDVEVTFQNGESFTAVFLL